MPVVRNPESAAVLAPKSVVHTDLSGKGQTVLFTQLLDYDGKRYRVRIRVDSYVNQSYGIIEFWNSSGWAELWSIPGELMNIPNNLGYRQPGPKESDFTLLRTKLFALGLKITEGQ